MVIESIEEGLILININVPNESTVKLTTQLLIDPGKYINGSTIVVETSIHNSYQL